MKWRRARAETIFFLIALGILSFLLYRAATPRKVPKVYRKAFPDRWFTLQRSFPRARLRPEEWLRAFAEARAFHKAKGSDGGEWKLVGPDNIGGRITDVQGTPLKPQRLFAATAAGGVFRSEDGGVRWTPTFSEDGSMSIGAMAIDPQSADRIWIGTGESNSSGSTYPGTGVYLSGDGGHTWQHMGLTQTQHIGRIEVHPTNRQTVFVAALGDLFGPSEERGVYRTRDGGLTWERVLFVHPHAGAIDLAINPRDPQTIYAALWDRKRTAEKWIAGGVHSAIYRSRDGGDTWEKLGQGLPSGATTGRIGLSLCAANTDIVYSIFDDTRNHFNGIYKSTDAGTSWKRVQDSSLSGMYSTFGWWFGNIRVDPSDCDTVFALGLSLQRSKNGGASWTRISGLHADQHALYIDPNNPQRVFLGNDGGIYHSSNGGQSFTKVRKLPVTQFYAVSFDPNGPSVLGGSQDNGTVRTKTGGVSDWEGILGGDGFQSIVDGNTIYAESQNGALARSRNGGSSFESIAPGANRANWNTPILLDPNDRNVLFYGGDKLYRSPNQGSSWSAVSPDLSIPPSGKDERDILVKRTITAFTVAKSDSKVIYAGTDNGHVWGTRDGGKNWNYLSGALPKRWITSLAADPSQAGRVVATISGYRDNEPLPHVFLSEDFGLTWKAVQSNLPEIPVNVVRLHPERPSQWYLGTDAGAYVTMNAGETWAPLGSGLPVVPIIDLALDAKRGILYAATFGRSLYSLGIPKALAE